MVIASTFAALSTGSAKQSHNPIIFNEIAASFPLRDDSWIIMQVHISTVLRIGPYRFHLYSDEGKEPPPFSE